MITQANLKELLIYNPCTGVFTNKTTRSARAQKGDEAGCITTDGYIVIRIKTKLYLAHRLAWLYVHGEHPPELIDHSNQDRSDNSISNLSLVNFAGNSRNTRISGRNKSGCVGVYWSASTDNWRAVIAHNGKQLHLGLFDDINCAIEARKEAEKKYGYHKNHGR